MSNLLARILTRSFPGKADADRQSDTARRRAEDSASSSAIVSEYESRAFALWAEMLARQDTAAVLDLGQARTGTLEYLRACSTRVSILALDPLVPLAEQLSLLRPDRPFAAVLAWDLPNYLDAATIAQLGDWLATWTLPGAPLFVCLATKVPYAGRPGRYQVTQNGSLHHEVSSSEPARTTLLAASELAKLLPAFVSVRSFLLRSGVQEHVLQRRS